MTEELPFNGFHTFIELPLVSDQRSFALVKRCFLELHDTTAHPFSLLLKKLTGKTLPEHEALLCWQQIIKHKMLMQQKLSRTVGIQTAACDYFEYQSPADLMLPSATAESAVPAKSDQTFSSDYRLEKLKEELLRSKRYKHALSVILIDIDNFNLVNNRLGFERGDQILTTIVQIIKKVIRNVDFLSRLSGDRFLLILPNTNQREAKELAERIRIQIFERTQRLQGTAEGITATLSVGQSSNSETSLTFIRRIERVLDDGQKKERNTVYISS